MENFYPLVLEPDGLSSLKNSVPPLPKKPTPPAKPKEEYLKELIFGYLWAAFCVIIILIMMATDSTDGSGALIPGMFLSSFLLILFQNFLNSYNTKKHETTLFQYNKDLEKYESNLFEYNRAVSILNNPKSISDFIRGQESKIYKKALRLSKSDVRSKRGISEYEFVSELSNYFPNQILTGKAVGYNSWEVETHYQPDIILIEPSLSLHIDIEIDEPYTLENKIPIHFLNCPKDLQRDKYFQQNGWFVIRFAEEQIIKYPKECCKFIAETLNPLTGIDEYFKKPYGKKLRVPKIKKWTKEESISMAKNDFRRSYLFEPSSEVGDKTYEEELKENGFNLNYNEISNMERFQKFLEISRRHGRR